MGMGGSQQQVLRRDAGGLFDGGPVAVYQGRVQIAVIHADQRDFPVP